MYYFGCFPGVALVYKYYVLHSLLILYIQPLKMELIEGSETSAYNNQTPGKHPKEYIIDLKQGESLKSRITKARL